MQMLIQNAKLRDREELVNILIDGGKIVEIGAGLTAEAETVIDAEGNLTTASYIDPHIHLDKVNVLDVLPKNQSGTLKEAIEMLWDQKRRAEYSYPYRCGYHHRAEGHRGRAGPEG